MLKNYITSAVIGLGMIFGTTGLADAYPHFSKNDSATVFCWDLPKSVGGKAEFVFALEPKKWVGWEEVSYTDTVGAAMAVSPLAHEAIDLMMSEIKARGGLSYAYRESKRIAESNYTASGVVWTNWYKGPNGNHWLFMKALDIDVVIEKGAEAGLEALERDQYSRIMINTTDMSMTRWREVNGEEILEQEGFCELRG